MHAWMTITQLYVLLRIPSTQVHSKASCRLCQNLFTRVSIGIGGSFLWNPFTYLHFSHPSNDTYRVFSADVHKTRDYYHVNITITDGNTTTNTWKQRDKSDIKPVREKERESERAMITVGPI